MVLLGLGLQTSGLGLEALGLGLEAFGLGLETPGLVNVPDPFPSLKQSQDLPAAADKG